MGKTFECLSHCCVPEAGFEPARLAASDFKSLAAADYATPANDPGMQKGKRTALPLERKTRFELATFSLARRRATAAPLPHFPSDADYSRMPHECQAKPI